MHTHTYKKSDLFWNFRSYDHRYFILKLTNHAPEKEWALLNLSSLSPKASCQEVEAWHLLLLQHPSTQLL